MTCCSPTIWASTDSKSAWAPCSYGKREFIDICNVLFHTSTHMSNAITKRVSSEKHVDGCNNRFWRDFKVRERSWSVSWIVLRVRWIDASTIIKWLARHPALISNTVSTRAGWPRAVRRNQPDMMFELKGKAICDTYVLSNTGLNNIDRSHETTNLETKFLVCKFTYSGGNRSPGSHLCIGAMKGTPPLSLLAYSSIGQVHVYHSHSHLSPHFETSDDQ